MDYFVKNVRGEWDRNASENKMLYAVLAFICHQSEAAWLVFWTSVQLLYIPNWKH